MTPEGNQVICLLNDAAAKTVAHRINPSLPYQLLILPPLSLVLELPINKVGNDITEIYACHNSQQQSETPYLQEIIDLIMGRTHHKELTGKEPMEIIAPLNEMQVDCFVPQ